MFYDEPIKHYADINYNINKLYCQKYGIDIIVSSEKKYTDRHAAWERLPLLLRHISDYDYLIWIDADAFFYYEASNILDIIHRNSEANFIFSNDLGDKNINTGIFIVKSSQYSIDFLTKWAYDEEWYKRNPKPWWWDQGVFVDMFNHDVLHIQQNVVIYSYGTMQHFHNYDKLDKTLVFHLAGVGGDLRYRASKEYFDRLKQILGGGGWKLRVCT